jgi:hypothetical protein
VGRYAVILQEYDESLKPSDVSFSSVTMWVHILDLPFGWMNSKRGSRAASLIGEVKKVEADAEGKVNGPFLRARVVLDISKPLQRGIMLKKDKSSAPPEWFKIQYENLPFFYYSCGLIGHFEIACPLPQARDADGKLPYEHKKLHAPDDRRRKPPSFAQAATESFGSSTSLGRNKGVDQPMQNSHGPGKEPIHNQYGDGEGSGDGVTKSVNVRQMLTWQNPRRDKLFIRFLEKERVRMQRLRNHPYQQ